MPFARNRFFLPGIVVLLLSVYLSGCTVKEPMADTNVPKNTTVPANPVFAASQTEPVHAGQTSKTAAAAAPKFSWETDVTWNIKGQPQILSQGFVPYPVE